MEKAKASLTSASTEAAASGGVANAKSSFAFWGVAGKARNYSEAQTPAAVSGDAVKTASESIVEATRLKTNSDSRSNVGASVRKQTDAKVLVSSAWFLVLIVRQRVF